MGKTTVELRLGGGKWSHSGKVWARGSAFVGGQQKRPEDICQHFDGVTDKNGFLSSLKELNGFFAVVVKQENALFAAVDRVRSIPLFYSWSNERLLLSDDAHWIEARLKEEQLDALSVGEFLLTGYVTGRHTLHSHILQLQAGEYLIAEFSQEKSDLQVDRYYQFKPSDALVEPESMLLQKLDEAVLASIERLITFAAGRPIAIPLSGGIDSRLIALGLKQLGYRNVLAFSYGRRGNNEAQISQAVAVGLGIPWYFIEYSEALWHLWYNLPEWQQYSSFAEGLSSVAHLQDWPAVMELKRQGVLPSESVIVPGHTGDFVSGGHIPQELLRFKVFDLETVAKTIWRHHYVLTTLDVASRYSKLNPTTLVKGLTQRIVENFKDIAVKTLEDAIGTYYLWEWGERQAKFIVNAVRVYDFWGYEWWLPWWDLEFLEFWSKVPLVYRLNRQLYRRYVANVQHKLGLTVEQGLISIEDKSLKTSVKNVLERAHLLALARWVYRISIGRYIRSRALEVEYKEHPLAWYGIVDFSRYKELLRATGNINTILAVDQIERRRQRFKTPETKG